MALGHPGSLMTPINYNHLYYFYRVAVDGGITAASRHLHLTPQTISGQITALEQQIGYPLFERQGKKLALTQRGRMVLSYAEDIFHLGDELRALLKQPEIVERLSVTIGIVDVIPKALAYALIKPVNSLPQPVHLVCREGNLEHLLAELAVNRLDVVLSERPIPPGTRLRAYNHLVVETDIALFGTPALIAPYQPEFPASLTGAPLLMPSAQTMLSQLLLSWFDQHDITPQPVGEFDDSALAYAFCHEGLGLVAAPALIADDLREQFGIQPLGILSGVRAQFYALSPHKKIKHPAIVAMVNRTRFGD